MDTLSRIKELVEKISIDTEKVFRNGNKSATIRARKNAQEIKTLIPSFRKQLLDEMKKHDTTDAR